MKKYLLIALPILLFSCNITEITPGVESLQTPFVEIQTPSVPSGTYPLSKQITVLELDSLYHNLTQLNLSDASKVVLTGVSVNIMQPDTLTFQGFTYAKITMTGGDKTVTVFDSPLSISTKTHSTTCDIDILELIQKARQSNGKITYTCLVTTATPLPLAKWQIGSSIAITP